MGSEAWEKTKRAGVADIESAVPQVDDGAMVPLELRHVCHGPGIMPNQDASADRNDACDMRRMGKIQELKRNFRAFSALSFTVCVMGTWEILYLQNSQALIDGGKAGMFWCYVWIYFGQTFVILSLSEMSSMAPTAGGQYHWVSEFAPPGWQKILSYVSGWLSNLAWQLFVTSNASLSANLILAMITIGNPAFVIQPYMNSILIIAVTVVVGLINIFGTRALPRFEMGFAFLHVSCFVLVLAVLWSTAPRASASEIFLDFADNNPAGTQWQTIGLTLLVGQAPALFTVQGADSVVHIAEEVKDAGRIVPRAMMIAYIANIPFAFGILLTFLFTLGDVNKALATPTTFPFIYGIQNATSQSGAIGITFVMFLLIFMVATSVATSAVRQVYAFARDNGLPFSAWTSRVSNQWDCPVNAIYITCGFTIVLSFIYLGSPVTFNAIISLSVVAIMATYSISIGCVLLRRVRVAYYGGPQLPASSFSLGRYGMLVNSIALVFCIYSFFWCFWPISNTAEPGLFNWAVVIFAGVFVLATVTYLVIARKRYDGPVTKVDRDISQEMEI